MRACVCVSVRARVRVCVRECTRECVCVSVFYIIKRTGTVIDHYILPLIYH